MDENNAEKDYTSLQEAASEILWKSIYLLQDLDNKSYLQYAPVVYDMLYKYECMT